MEETDQTNINIVIKDTVRDKRQCTDIVNQLLDKYNENDYMYARVNNYICNQLPKIFDNMNEQHDQRVTRITELTHEKDNFIQSFFNNNQYFYSTSTDNFFFYDGINYEIFNEDDILHQVLSTISRDGALMSWKRKTKLNIMKRIRETSLLLTIPESITIQSVIDNLYPLIFGSRTEAKYFLTIIGDNILRKETSTIYFIDPAAKFFLKQLNNISQSTIGCNSTQTFKHKYYDHNYSDCRVIKINTNIKYDTIWSKILNENVINLICVACHYSMRYKSADEYIINYCNDQQLETSVFYIKNLNIDELVDTFVNTIIDIDENIQPSQLTNKSSTVRGVPQITWKNMQYLWKQFLTDKELPGVIFLNVLKNMLIKRMSKQYNEEIDSFIGVCSKFLPSINTFTNFWNDTMIEDDMESDLEIEEVIILLKQWCNINNEFVPHLTDKQILDLIIYYYPSTEIERDKYISHIRCSLWDKQMDIEIAMNNMKTEFKDEYKIDNTIERVASLDRVASLERIPSLERVASSIYRNVSIYDAYLYYSKYTSIPSTTSNKQTNRPLIVSKSYFEKYIFDNYSEYIIDSKFISRDWYLE